MAGTLAEPHAVSSAGWPSGRHASARIVDAAPVLPSWSASALARMQPLLLVQRSAAPATGPPPLGADAMDLATRPTTAPAHRSAILWDLFSPGAHGRQDQSTSPREDQMIRILHRILDIAAAAGGVAVTAHPAAALAHLGQPRAPRPTTPARWRSTAPQPAQRSRTGASWALNDRVDGRVGSGGHGDEMPAAHAPERLTWLRWARGAGSPAHPVP